MNSSESDGRLRSVGARLAKLGFADPDRAVARLAEFPDVAQHPHFLDELALAADPDLALNTTLDWWVVSDARLTSLWLEDAGLRLRWLVTVGASEAFSQFLLKHPREIVALVDGGAWTQPMTRDALVTRLLQSVDATWEHGRWVAERDDEAALDALRIAYKREVICIAARDLSGISPLEEVAQQLSYLADAVVEAAAAIAWRSVNPGVPRSLLSVIAMGKCGGRELNYVSDVDVIFVAEPVDEAVGGAIEEATRLASRLMQVCEQPTSEGMIWQVDPALRPEGKAGALVRTLEGHVAYYQRWAETWEFQALLKARFMAGDSRLGEAYVDAILPFVWQAAERPNFVTDVQAMRRRVVENIPVREQDRELKLGIGGLRDVEFAVQLLQLVHGRSDVMLRSSNTLEALQALVTWGYVGRDDASSLEAAYRFERTLEHRIQMFRMRRTHLVPESEDELRRLGRAMGMKNDPSSSLMSTLNRHKLDARRLHEKLFYRPLLQAVVRLDASDARLTMDAASDRLKALGFVDPENALRHLSSLSAGVSRRAAIQRTLLPVMLSWMAQTPNPDAGLLAFRKVSEALGATPWYLRLLRDESVVAQRLAHILCVSRYATELLMRAPEAVNLLSSDDRLVPSSYETLVSEMQSVAQRQESVEDAVAAIRSIRQRELFRIASADLLGLISVTEVSAALTNVADAVLNTALDAVVSRHWNGEPPTLRISLIGLGRLGGRELNYASDADACFVYEPNNGHERAATDALSIVARLQDLLTRPAQDPPFPLDLDLRPEGRQGAVARTLSSYRAYYERWSLTWESQALLRARYVAGDSELGAEFLAIIDALRYPAAGLSAEDLREIRRIKARVESERLPRGADPRSHVKLGPGGIADVEWVVQLMQLQHAGAEPSLRTTSTLAALDSLVSLKKISESESATLREAWQTAARIRNAIMLTQGKGSDSIPSQFMELRQLAFVLAHHSGAELSDVYRRVSRRARVVMEKYVYGIEANES